MKKLSHFLSVLFLGTLLLTSCGASGESSDDDYADNSWESRGKREESLNFKTSHDVITALSHQTFKSDQGGAFSFGGSASSVSCNGKIVGGAVKVLQIGHDDGESYGIFSFSSPLLSEPVVMMITESFGRIFIFDCEDPNTLFYKQ